MAENDGDDWQDIEWWCHSCEKKFEQPKEMKCPLCGGEFIEEIDIEDNPALQEESDEEDSSGISIGSDTNDHNGSSNQMQHQWTNNSQPQTDVGQNEQPNPQQPPQQVPLGNMIGQMMNQMFGPAGAGQENPFAQIMQQFGMPSNMGDYAFGDLDALIARLTDTNRFGTPPTNPEVLESLMKIKITQEHLEHSDVCAICQSDFAIGDEATELPCSAKHCFHGECIMPWLKEHSTCPTCREEFPSNDPIYEEQKQRRDRSYMN